MAWKGTGPFLRYGYYVATAAYIKGQCDSYPLDPQQCYAIVSIGTLRSPVQFHLLPVDQRGTILGPAVAQMSSQDMAQLWQTGCAATNYNVSDQWLA